MTIINSDDHHFDHYVNSGSILEFKCLHHFKLAHRDNLGELSGYATDFTEQNAVVHVRVNPSSYITRDQYPTILAMMFNMKPEGALSYYSDFEFVRAIRVDHEIALS